MSQWNSCSLQKWNSSDKLEILSKEGLRDYRYMYVKQFVDFTSFKASNVQLFE